MEIDIALPADLDEARRAALLAAELERAKVLEDSGVVSAIWRVPG